MTHWHENHLKNHSARVVRLKYQAARRLCQSGTLRLLPDCLVHRFEQYRSLLTKRRSTSQRGSSKKCFRMTSSTIACGVTLLAAGSRKTLTRRLPPSVSVLVGDPSVRTYVGTDWASGCQVVAAAGDEVAVASRPIVWTEWSEQYLGSCSSDKLSRCRPERIPKEVSHSVSAAEACTPRRYGPAGGSGRSDGKATVRAVRLTFER